LGSGHQIMLGELVKSDGAISSILNRFHQLADADTAIIVKDGSLPGGEVDFDLKDARVLSQHIANRLFATVAVHALNLNYCKEIT